MILERTIELLKSRYKNYIESLSIADACIGLYLTAIRLSDGSCGVASTDTSPHPPCSKENRDYGEFTPAKITGRRIIDLLSAERQVKAFDSIKIAALNAISMQLLPTSGYKIIEDKDPIDLVDLGSKKTVTLVGGFPSYIKRISGTNNKLYVLELDENFLGKEHKKYFVPAGEFSKILPVSDIIIITGCTLVNNTIDDLISAIPSHARVVVSGPSSSLLPDILFENRVNIIGATLITDPDVAFAVAAQAGSGYHLFRYCARKICILNEKMAEERQQ